MLFSSRQNLSDGGHRKEPIKMGCSCRWFLPSMHSPFSWTISFQSSCFISCIHPVVLCPSSKQSCPASPQLYVLSREVRRSEKISLAPDHHVSFTVKIWTFPILIRHPNHYVILKYFVSGLSALEGLRNGHAVDSPKWLPALLWFLPLPQCSQVAARQVHLETR